MSYKNLHKHSLEILEARIAPANVSILPVSSSAYVKASFGGPVELHAGQVLTTDSQISGSYLMYLEKGNAFVFLTDLNLNGVVDSNEVTGIAAGNGMRLVSFVDIHGDIVTNLKEQTVSYADGSSSLVLSLSDSDSNASNDSPLTRGDGRVLLNNTIEKIELRSLRLTDIAVDQNGDHVIDTGDVTARTAFSTYSIFGNIYAGRGFGASDGGLMIDSGGVADALGSETVSGIVPQVGFIKTGTAVAGEYYSFGVTRSLNDSNGIMVRFTPASGQVGGDIIGVKSTDFSLIGTAQSSVSTYIFNIDGLVAGKGGAGARGGNISQISLNGDDTGGYELIAGDGGRGTTGGAGGSISNFADTGSLTSKVVIRSGSGGAASSGGGGSAGNLLFTTYSIQGNVDVRGGDGGSGFTSGGNGASIASGVFSEFSPTTAVATIGGSGVGTTHVSDSSAGYTAQIGTHGTVDFDKDGFGDFVYTTKGTSQLVIMFGAPSGFRDQVDANGHLTGFKDRIYLSGARDVEALTVADLNNDGQLDIAVASNDKDSSGGIVVFLNQFEHDGSGTLLTSEDLNHNGHNDFVGFRAARHSVLPTLPSSVTDSKQVTSMVAGDFDGSGHTQLAIVTTSGPDQVLMFLTPDFENNASGTPVPTGQFYADFGALAVASPATPALPLTPYVTIAHDVGVLDTGFATVVIEASALTTTSTHDVVFAGAVGKNSVTTYDYSTRTALSGAPVALGTYGLGTVDTDRAITINFVDFASQDFTVVDLDADGNADIGAISADAYVVGVKGNGLGSGTQDSGSGSNNAGSVIDGEGHPVAIRSADVNGNGGINELVVLGGSIRALTYAPGSDGTTTTATYDLDNANSNPISGVVFDVYHNDASTTTKPSYACIDRIIPSYIDIVGDLHSTQALSERSLQIHAGNGGASLIGSGGNGGFLGGSANVVAGVYTGILDITTSHSLDLFAGSGGAGFTSGGAGGKVTGLSVSAGATSISAGAVTLTGGSGGRGVSLAGGAGGDISSVKIGNSITRAAIDFHAGDGGVGMSGGAGGSIIGNQTNNILYFDASTGFLTAAAGNGGAGVKLGGRGGSITQFRPNMAAGGGTGVLTYLAGNGGSAVSGPGGSGGSISDSAPQVNADVDGGIRLTAGDGGHGLSGGSGGSISTFVLSVASGLFGPSLMEVLAGHGGDGDAGAGGVGGSISGVTASGSGKSASFLDKFLAGNGGSSAAGRGGAGGALTAMNIGLSQGTIAFAAGAGGDGLAAGGVGGSVLDVIAKVAGASTLNKALVIAGAGGNASAFIPNLNDDAATQLKDSKIAFGGVIGVGGLGGSINGFSETSQNGAHYDLIAGNGGSTLNYGRFNDTKSYVGNGGSILNVKIAGDIGSYASNVAIVSYNDLSAKQTIAEYVEANLRSLHTAINDADGNVGIVVGSAGRNKSVVVDSNFPTVYATTPAQGASNGSLIGVSANRIMSAVAGNVNLIAAIQVAKNVTTTSSGAIGADKGAAGLNYLDTAGAPSNAPVLNGALVDGALVYYSLSGVAINSRVVSLA